MRPTTSTMLQQNNNNNYPCLNMSGTTREMLQKCSRAALPFPSRLELGDLPLIRGLRAWALCSKNRRKAGGLLGGGQSPTARPAGHRNTSCTKPADVYLSGEWGQMGYGLPLGLDARQAEIGALVTVASLKTSEGSGKTQTQCLFLRTEKGSCLYSTAKPGSGVATSAASSVVGGWLKGKTGGGGSRDTTAGRRDGGSTLSLQTGANRVRMRSGRRWRKSSNAAAREKPVVSRERQQRSREDPAKEITLGDRKEVLDKGALDSKLFHSLQQDGKRAQQDKDGACRTPKCSHNASPKTCPQCGRGGQRDREGQKEHVGGESPSNEMKEMRKEKPKVDEEEEKEEDKSSLCELGSSNFGLSIQNPDQESNSFHPQSAEETREAESNEEQDSHGKDDCLEKGKGNRCEEVHVNRLSDRLEANRESEKGSVTQTPTETSAESNHYQDISVSSWPESSANVEGSSCWGQRELGNTHEEQRQAEEDPGIICKKELHISSFEPREQNFVANENNTVKSNKNRKPEVFCGDCRRDELVSKERINSEGGDEAGEQELDDDKSDNKKEPHTEDVVSAGAKLENHCEIKRNCSQEDDWRSQESADGCKKQEKEDGDTCGQTSITQAEARGKSSTDVTNVACADPSSSPGLCLANEAPSPPPLGSMATGLPRLVAEVEEEEDGVRVTARDGEAGQKGKRRIGIELEEQGERERGSTVATGEERKEEEEEVEEDEFGVFMQAEGEPACSERVTMSASVPCGSRASVGALGNHTITGEPTCWTDSSSHQSEDSWTAFPQDSADGGGDAAGQWWPSSAAEERRLSAGPSLVSVFAEAFPSLPGSSSCDPCDLDTVPTLTQLLRGRANQDHGLLDSFHDLNKMIGQRYKRDAGVSRDLLLKTLHLEQPPTESRPAPWAANRRLSPGLPSANQHAQNAAAKRRLSYDYNRNIVD